jgi:hypothetical protein
VPKLTYSIMEREQEPDLYSLMDELVAEYHSHLEGARIALAWRFGWKGDPDGRMILGRCHKASDLNRQLHNFDFVILLNNEVWTSAEFSDAQKRALLDHELCHAAVALDKDGFPKQGADDRTKYRIRKHTIEEFHEVVDRHGIWKGDIASFVKRAMASRAPHQMPLADASTVMASVVSAVADPEHSDPRLRKHIEALRPTKGSGIESVTITSGGRSATLKAN